MTAEPRPVLVTGGTGTLGRQVVRRLLEDGRPVRVLSRRPRPQGDDGTYEWVTGDLAEGRGIARAVDGVRAVVHCATTLTRKDVAATRRLVEAARDGGRPAPHLLYISIVGIDRVPLRYYRVKLATERVVEESGLPWTILRTTQFHDLVARITTAQRRLPFVLVPSGVRCQPVDTREVADRLAALAAGEAAGRVPDLAGPEVRTLRDLAAATLRAYGRRRPLVPLRLPGKTMRGFRAGGHLAPERALGRITFEEYLADTVGGSAAPPPR